MAAYVQYWEDIIAELEAETAPQAPTTLQFGFWPSIDFEHMFQIFLQHQKLHET
jgi:hypothetical protein